MKYIAITFFCVLLALPLATQADSSGLIEELLEVIVTETELPAGQIETEAIPTIISAVLAVFGVLLTGLCVWSGVQIVTSMNDEENITAAKKYFTWSLTGVGVVALSYAFVYAITNLSLSPAT